LSPQIFSIPCSARENIIQRGRATISPSVHSRLYVLFMLTALGQSLHTHSALSATNVRYAPKATRFCGTSNATIRPGLR
jgi:hypothetical protein